jgi:hypothetical protein
MAALLGAALPILALSIPAMPLDALPIIAVPLDALPIPALLSVDAPLATLLSVALLIRTVAIAVPADSRPAQGPTRRARGRGQSRKAIGLDPS